MKAFPYKQKAEYEYLGVIDGMPKYECKSEKIDNKGMDLRDYFAAKAMQGFFSIYSGIKVDEGNTKAKFIAENAYLMADLMMEARK